MAKRAIRKPDTRHGELTDKAAICPDSVFAFPKEPYEPLTDASHVRNALARFNQVEGVTDEERDLAWANIKKAARHYGVEIHETDWHRTGQSRAHANEPRGRMDSSYA